MALDPGRAPVTTENFLRYVRGGFYDGGRFHRTVTPRNQPGQAVKIGIEAPEGVSVLRTELIDRPIARPRIRVCCMSVADMRFSTSHTIWSIRGCRTPVACGALSPGGPNSGTDYRAESGQKYVEGTVSPSPKFWPLQSLK